MCYCVYIVIFYKTIVTPESLKLKREETLESLVKPSKAQPKNAYNILNYIILAKRIIQLE